ncbi:MAG: pitrilysin family protein [Petrimonas sp.]|nr:pitrilysin family protein [Petrimonas sp.]
MTGQFYHTHTLSNGLRIIHQLFPSEISYCGFAVNTGSRDEMPDEHGMAHFVEHMLFKGTRHRRAHHIINRMENVGGELNAYTTKEETFVYAAFLEEHIARAVELLSDILFNSVFPPAQIERERDVVLDEINSYVDSPAELVYDDFENRVFDGHELGHYILGTPESLAVFDSDKARNFVRRQYHPAQMVFFSFGKTGFSRIVKLAEKYLSFSSGDASPKNRVPAVAAAAGEQALPKNTAQSHVVMGTTLFGMHHPKRFEAYLLNHILGGASMSSRLNTSLREKHGLAYNAESNLVFYSDVGVFSVYYACDPKNTNRCLRLVEKELNRLMQTPLTAMQLSAAKRQLKGQLGISAQNNESVALGMAKSFLHFNRYYSFAETFEKIDAVTSAQLQQMAVDIWNTGNIFRLRY